MTKEKEHGRRTQAQGWLDNMRTFLLAAIRFYQACISPALPSSCRYYPSCSEYAYAAVEKWGCVLGLKMALARLLRCWPWGGYGCDPVP
jgi:putative membrane protein insertion efficiency factor